MVLRVEEVDSGSQGSYQIEKSTGMLDFEASKLCVCVNYLPWQIAILNVSFRLTGKTNSININIAVISVFICLCFHLGGSFKHKSESVFFRGSYEQTRRNNNIN